MGCKCHPTREIKKKKPFCFICILTYSFALWWWQNRFERYQHEVPAACRKIQESHKSVESQGNINAFHFSLMSLQLGFSGWPGWLGLWGRWGSDSPIQQSLTHTRSDTHLGRVQTLMYSRWHLWTYMHILKIPWHLTKTPRQRMCRESGPEKRAQPLKKCRENETFLRMRTDMASGRGRGRQTIQRPAAPHRQGATRTQARNPAYCGLLG